MIAAVVFTVGAIATWPQYHWRVTDTGPNDDAAVRTVVNEYVDGINADDLSRLLDISVGTAQLNWKLLTFNAMRTMWEGGPNPTRRSFVHSRIHTAM